VGVGWQVVARLDSHASALDLGERGQGCRALCAGMVCCVLLIVVSVPVRTAERPAGEPQKIKALIQHVERLPDAVCIRQ